MLFEDDYYCIGDEKEIKGYNRKLYFDNDDLEIKGKYNVLLPKYQNIVNGVLCELSAGEFFGLNLKRFLEGYKKATPSIAQFKISSDIAEFIERDLYADKFMVDKQINSAKTSGKLKGGAGQTSIEAYTSYICEYFLTEDSLLKKGIGKISTIKSEWYNRFIADINSSPFGKQLATDTGRTWTTLRCVKKYEEYLRDKNELKENDSILEENWAVMVYSGAYQLLKKDDSRQNEKRALDRLINELYVRQLLDGEMPTIEAQV